MQDVTDLVPAVSQWQTPNKLQSFWWFGQLTKASNIDPGNCTMRAAVLLSFGTRRRGINGSCWTHRRFRSCPKIRQGRPWRHYLDRAMDDIRSCGNATDGEVACERSPPPLKCHAVPVFAVIVVRQPSSLGVSNQKINIGSAPTSTSDSYARECYANVSHGVAEERIHGVGCK